jgi:exopolyphosphatase/guanosine-5'-triphosphate,3'-diphosphate pyrophosphatase
VTTPLGPQRLGELTKGTGRARALIDQALAPLVSGFARTSGRLYLVGGAWRTLGRVEISRTGHPLHVLHEHAFSPEDGHLVARWILAADAGTLQAVPGVSSDRVGTLPHAALLLEALIDHFAPAEIVLSGFGLREGLAWEYLPAHLRRQDPLISTVAGHERTRARAPGFGAELAAWLLAAWPAQDAEDERLIRASCHLADVSWRSHPDYRASACVEVVTRMHVSSAGHAGRAFIAAALLARYGGAKGLDDEPILLLLSPQAADRARRIGALMRLGCAISGATPGFLPLCPLALADGTLRLSPAREALPLLGEQIEKRLAQAAKALGAKGEIAPP